VLLFLCIEKDSTFDEIGYITALTPYAVEIRYGELVELSKEEVVELVLQTEGALNFILGKI
jgi:hypothetical protein